MTSDDVVSNRKRRHRNERIAAAALVIVLAAVTAGVVWWQKRTAEDLRSDRRYIPKVGRITPEIELLQEYVRIDSSTPEGAAKAARWLAAQLEKRGVHPEIIESAPGRLNVYARIKGRSPGEGLMLFNHVDVVPPDGHWTVPPFDARLAVNMMWGRGTLDMKALGLCQLLAYTAVAHASEPPPHDLVFLATADEETGSAYGMRWLLEHRPDVFANIRYGITEGGITEVLSEEMTYFGIEVSAKQVVDLTVEGPDVASLRKARFALEPAIFPRAPQRVLPAVRQYFHDIAPTRMAYRPFLTDIDATIRKGDFWSLPTTYRDLTQDSLWVSAPMQTGNRWQMTVKMVNLPDAIPDARLAWLEGVIRPYGVRIAEVREKQGPVPDSPANTPVFALLAKTAHEQYGVPAGVQVLFRSTTDSRFLRQHGVYCYGVCPFPVDYYLANTIHGTDERIRLDAFTEGLEYMLTVIGEWGRG